MEPLSKVLLGSGLHHEERATHIDHLPRKEDREPSKTGESGGTSTEYSRAAVVEALVAPSAKVAITKTEHDDREGSKAQGSDPKTVEDHVDHDLDSEDTTLELDFISMSRSLNQVESELTL